MLLWGLKGNLHGTTSEVATTMARFAGEQCLLEVSVGTQVNAGLKLTRAETFTKEIFLAWCRDYEPWIKAAVGKSNTRLPP